MTSRHGILWRLAASLAVALPLAAVLSLSACSDPAAGHPNVLLVVVDTLRQDHLEPYGYSVRPTTPALAELAQESVQLSGLTGVSSWTQPSMATLYTGLPPSRHRVSRINDRLREPRTLAARLKEAGYDTACVMSNFLLQPKNRGGQPTGYAVGFDFYDFEIAARSEPHLGSTAGEVTDKAVSWLRRASDSKPWLLNVHYFDPHIAYEAHPEYGFADPGYRGWVRGGLPRAELQKHQESTSEADRRQLAALYDGEVRAVDDAIGRLLAEVRGRADWSNTIVVFTADHGEELSERGYIGHTVTLHFEQTDLPLLVRLPGGARAGAKVDARLPQTGMFATVLELCGLESLPGRGESFAGVLTGAQPAQDLPCFSEVDFVAANARYSNKNTRMRSVVAEGHKLIHDLMDEIWHLYDLSADPSELHDLAGIPDHAALQQRLTALLESHDWLELQ